MWKFSIVSIVLFINSLYGNIFSRYPYISMLDKNKIAIVFKTSIPCSSMIIIENLTERKITSRSDVIYDTMHVFYFSLPSGIYKYVIIVRDSLISNDKFTFRIPSSSDSVLSFLIFGDSGTGGKEQFEVRDAISKFLNEQNIDFIIHTGDVVYPNGEPWLYDSRYFEVYRDILCGKFSFLTPGNHDYYYDGKGTGYFSSFFLPTNEYETEEFYTFSWGNTFFISLNITGFVDYSPGSKQYNWLIRVLSSEEAQSKRWRIVFFHIPPVSTTRWYDPGVFITLLPIFKSFKVNLILCGHVHGYERGYLNGILMVTTGGGGAYLHQMERKTSEIVKYAFAHNFCWVSIDRDSMLIIALDKNLKVIDSLALSIDSNSNLNNINNINNKEDIFAFPNPFNSGIYFVLNFHSEVKPVIYIYDILGSLIAKAEQLHTDSGTIYYWNGKNNKGKNASSGIYIAVIDIAEGKRIRKKILKIK